MPLRRFCMVAVLAALAAAAPVPAAADVELTAKVEPSTVPVGGQCELVVTVRGKFRRTSPPQLPDLDAFDIYEAGTSQQFSFTMGRQTSSIEYRYVLIPKQAGTYSITPIRFKLGSDVYTANDVKVEVVKAGAPTRPQGSGGADAGEGVPLHVAATVDHDTVYVNQQITWTLGFYTDGTVELLRSPEYQPPNAEGFWVEDLPPQNTQYQTIDGRQYLVTQIKRGFFPTAPGVYTIGAARVDVVANDGRSRSAFDNLFQRRGGFGFGKPRSFYSEEIKIVVLPLPMDKRPPNFTGLVGTDLNVNLTVDKQVVNAGDPVNVWLEIHGQGNFKTIASPQLPDLPNFKRYESGAKSDLYKNDYVVSGRKKTDFVLIPRDAGETVIPAVTVAFFDPVKRRYRTATSQPVALSVQPAAEEEGRPVIFTGSGQDIEVLGRDINFIRPVPASLAQGGTPFYRTPVAIALQALPLLALVASIVIEQRRRRWAGNQTLARASRAAKQADKALEQARRADPAQAYAMIAAALREYVAAKMAKSSAGLTEAETGEFLAMRNVDDETADKVHSILRDCDAAQYSGAQSLGDPVALVESAVDVIHTMEKKYLS